MPEVELVAKHAPGAKMAFMHPVKSRAAITRAYFDFGVKTFALDSHEELRKIIEATGNARDLDLIVRLAVSAEGAAYSLSGKFGVALDQAPGAVAGGASGDLGAHGRLLPCGQPVHAADRLSGGDGPGFARAGSRRCVRRCGGRGRRLSRPSTPA